MSQEKWDRRFLELAKLVSTWSKDPSTQCGAIITRGKHIISVGFNGFPAGCSDLPNLYENRDIKYSRIIHAEINAILSSKQDLTECTIYIHPLFPCSQCTAAVIQSGITKIVSKEATDALKERWHESIMLSKDMLNEAEIAWISYN